MNQTLRSRRRYAAMVAALALVVSVIVGLPTPSGAASATVTPTTLAFGNVQVGNSASKTVTLTISSGYILDDINSANGTDISVTTGAPTDYAVGTITGTCYVASGGKCLISVNFSPHEIGVSKATLNMHVCRVDESAVCIVYTAALNGAGTAPGKLSPTSVSFGSVAKGATKTQKITVTVNANFYVSGVDAAGDPSFGVADVAPDCIDVGPGTCTFLATFTPYQGAGVKGSVHVTFCRSDGLVCVVDALPVSGTGSPAASISPTAHSFGTVVTGTLASTTITVKVFGGWYVQQITTSGAPFDYANLDDGCGPIGPVNCTFDATYFPTAAGASTGSVTVLVCSLSGQYCDSYVIKLTGTGKLAGTVSPIPLAFGNAKVGLTASKPVTVTYDSGWQVQGVRFDASQSVLSTDVASACDPANPGTKCVFTATFAPAALGPLAANMIVTVCKVDGTLCSDLKPDPVTGNGTAPATETPTTLSFGNVPVNGSATKTFSVKPDPGWYVHRVVPGMPVPPYSAQLDPICTADVTPGTPCVVDVTFAPLIAKAQPGKIAVELCQVSTGNCFTMTPVSATGTGIQTATTSKLVVETVRPSLGFHDHLTVTVSPQVDGGTVYFYAAGLQVCSVPVDSNSTATCIWTPSHTGSYQLKAIYSGDAAFKGSTSNVTTATAVLPPP